MIPDVIRSGDTTLCLILRGGELPSTSTFITPGDAALQVGQIVHPRGHEIPRHSHRPTARHLTSTSEVLLVQRGCCEIDIYDDQRTLLTTCELREGDIIVLLGGGHGFRMIEDTVLLEIKQGPYQGPGEKEQF